MVMLLVRVILDLFIHGLFEFLDHLIGPLCVELSSSEPTLGWYDLLSILIIYGVESVIVLFGKLINLVSFNLKTV